jgi:putative DNA primase/helicase
MMSTHEIEQWLGTPLFLVPCRPGTKVPLVKYTQHTLQSTAAPTYQALLEHGNVAVRLGEHSGGFCAIDFDDDQSLEAFLAVNPKLKTTSRWRGRRGAQIGVRISGPYPGPSSARSTTEMVEVNGRQLGRPLYEWRSTGNLSTVKGTHPSGCEYTVLVDNPPITLDFSQIRWPEGWPVPGENEAIAELLQQHGDPWVFSKQGTGTLQAPFFAAYLAAKERILFDTVTGCFYFYLADRGIWQSMTREEVGQRVLAMARKVILDHAADQAAPHLRSLLPKLTAQFSNGVIDLAAQLQVERAPFNRPDAIVHTENVMVDLRVTPYGMHGFSPEWMSRNQTPIRYVEGATSPMWQAFLDHALPEAEDQLMLQHWGGLALLQRNQPQVILLLTGTGGGGKSTVAGVVRRLVGDENCSELRTNHLGGRFEAGLFHDKTLLIGADVAPDFLSCEGSSFLKAMTGGDRIIAEFKNRNGVKTLIGDWNVIVTANSKLRVNVQGDLGAWSRRLLLLDFSQPKPSTVIPNYHDVMIDKEGPGILNWFLSGAESLQRVLKQGRSFPVTTKQRARIDSLLSESDSIRYFITNHIKPTSMAADSISTEELFQAYLQMCGNKEWASEPEKKFQRRAAELMLEVHQAIPTKHLNRSDRDDSGTRGYLRVMLYRLDEACNDLE